MAWRVARSLQVLTTEVRTLHPGTTVWTIGDAAHRGTASDHNPNSANVVCAADFLPDRGLNLAAFAEAVRTSGHPAAKYVIYNRRIASASRGWTWRSYTGSNPHTGHVHVSVGVGPDGRSIGPYDDTSPWGLLEEDDMPLTNADIDRIALAVHRKTGQFIVDGTVFAGQGTGRLAHQTYSIGTGARNGWAYGKVNLQEAKKIQKQNEAILDAVGGLDTAAILARIDQRAGEDAARDAALLELVEQAASGEVDAAEVVRLIGEKLTAAAEPA